MRHVENVGRVTSIKRKRKKSTNFEEKFSREKPYGDPPNQLLFTQKKKSPSRSFAFDMSSPKEVVSDYAQNIWLSIAKNIEEVAPDDSARLSQLAKDINKFYLSLFSPKNGKLFALFVACAFVRLYIVDSDRKS